MNICQRLKCSLFDEVTEFCIDDKRVINKETGQVECRYCSKALIIHRTTKYYVIDQNDRYHIVSENYKNYIIAQGECREEKLKEISKGFKYIDKIVLTEKELLDIIERNDIRRRLVRKCRY